MTFPRFLENLRQDFACAGRSFRNAVSALNFLDWR